MPTENIIVGEGIDALLGYLVRLIVEPGVKVISSRGAYPTFNYHVRGAGGELILVPFKNDYEDLETLVNVALKQSAKIIYLSNPQRGLECFEYIFPLLKNKYSNITLEIYSSLDMYNIEDNTYLKNLYSRLEKMEGIYCNKSISQKELVSKLNKSLLFIYPTFVEETFCNCMIEAMSCGCYVISTNIGALKEIASPYGDFIDIDKTKSPEHPYYESIDNEYINKIVEKTSKIIDKYNINDIKLENLLEKQIEFIKKKYNWKNQSKYLYEKLI